MDERDVNLRELYKIAIENNPTKRDNCPDTETLLKSVYNKLPENEKFAIVDHLFKCQGCQEEFKAIKRFYNESNQLGEGLKGIKLKQAEADQLKEKLGSGLAELPPELHDNIENENEKIIKLKGTLIKSLVSAAALVVIVFSSLLLFNTNSESNIEKSVYRGAADLRVSLLQPLGIQKNFDFQFKWKIKKGDSFKYRLIIYNAELSKLWESPVLQVTHYHLPKAVQKKITLNTQYFWRVKVHTKELKRIDSKLSNFKIAGIKK